MKITQKLVAMWRNLIAIWRNLTAKPPIVISSEIINSDITIEEAIARERLRQARQSFNFALTTSKISFYVGLIGAGLALSNIVPQAVVISAIGMVSSVRYSELAENANDRLDRIRDESCGG